MLHPKIVEIKKLISGQVDMGTYGLVELALKELVEEKLTATNNDLLQLLSKDNLIRDLVIWCYHETREGNTPLPEEIAERCYEIITKQLQQI